jgi:hypothetical protein
MLDPEALILRVGSFAIITLAVVRIVLHDVHNIWTDLQKWRRRR